MLRSSRTKKFLSVLLTAGLVMSSFSYLAFADDEIIEDVADAEVEQAEVVEEDKDEEIPAVDEDAADEDIIDDDEEVIDEDTDDEDVPVDENVDEDVTEETSEEAVDEEPAEEPETTEAGTVDVPRTSGNNKVLIWIASNQDQWSEPVIEAVKSAFNSISGVTVVTQTGGSITSTSLEGVEVVYMTPTKTYYNSTDGQNLIGSADALKGFVEAGGRLILNGEWGTYDDDYSGPGNKTLKMLGSAMGFDFTISGGADSNEMIFNTDAEPELTDGLTGLFKTKYIGRITSTDPDAVWVVKNTENWICMLEKKIGDGLVVVMSDFNYADYYSTSEAATKALMGNIFSYGSKHFHSFTYSAEGAELTALCTKKNCDLENNKVTITINAPTLTVYNGDGDAEATLTGIDAFDAATGLAVSDADIEYAGTGSTDYGPSNTAPDVPGTYRASINVNNKIAYVDYEIAKADINPTVTIDSWVFGESPNDPAVTGNTGNGKVSYFYKEQGAEDSTYTDSVPTAEGKYTVKASIQETDNYNGNEVTADFEIKAVAYSFDKDSYVWTKGSNEVLVVKASRNASNNTTINHFLGVLVDNTAVNDEDCEILDGSVIVKLKVEYLNKLDLGNHTIKFVFDDAPEIEAKFTVKKADPASPQTGEYAGPAVLAAATLLMTGGAVLALKARKREEV
ncbi:hypothetical protein SAMN02910456_00894 [Ruminococcaceae bacterium YRB3002]|nr:hypothetical protein SAMN02910456_00894 [Ruminococcaceae bacterium YRB3002]